MVSEAFKKTRNGNAHIKLIFLICKLNPSRMKKNAITLIIHSLLFSSVMFFANSASAQSSKDKSLIQDCDSAKAEFIKTDASLSKVFGSATGYVIFPNVGKGAVGIGGASGNGIVYERGV